MVKKTLNTLDTGWLSPGGVFYQTEYMEHLTVAEKLYKAIHSSESSSIPPSDIDDALLRAGWCKICCVTFLEHGYLIHFIRHLTPEQKAVIKPIYEEEREKVIKSNRFDLDEELY